MERESKMIILWMGTNLKKKKHTRQQQRKECQDIPTCRCRLGLQRCEYYS